MTAFDWRTRSFGHSSHIRALLSEPRSGGDRRASWPLLHEKARGRPKLFVLTAFGTKTRGAKRPRVLVTIGRARAPVRGRREPLRAVRSAEFHRRSDGGSSCHRRRCASTAAVC